MLPGKAGSREEVIVGVAAGGSHESKYEGLSMLSTTIPRIRAFEQFAAASHIARESSNSSSAKEAHAPENTVKEPKRGVSARRS